MTPRLRTGHDGSKFKDASACRYSPHSSPIGASPGVTDRLTGRFPGDSGRARPGNRAGGAAEGPGARNRGQGRHRNPRVGPARLFRCRLRVATWPRAKGSLHAPTVPNSPGCRTLFATGGARKTRSFRSGATSNPREFRGFSPEKAAWHATCVRGPWGANPRETTRAHCHLHHPPPAKRPAGGPVCGGRPWHWWRGNRGATGR